MATIISKQSELERQSILMTSFISSIESHVTELQNADILDGVEQVDLPRYQASVDKKVQYLSDLYKSVITFPANVTVSLCDEGCCIRLAMSPEFKAKYKEIGQQLKEIADIGSQLKPVISQTLH